MKKEQRRPRLSQDEFQLIETYRELKRKAYTDGKKLDEGETLYIESKLAQSPKDIIKEFGIDTEIWEQTKFEPGGWTTPVKTKFRAEIGDDIYTAQIPVVIKNKKTTSVFQKKTKIIDYEGFKRDLISDLKKKYSKGIDTPKKYVKNNTGDLLEISLPDVHLGKFGWAEETGSENYNTKIAVQRHNKKIDELIGKALNYSKPEHILFVVGNDLFNSDKDTPYSMTTAGTPQENDTRWQKVFRIGRNMIIENIEKLKQIAPVTVKVIPGNHDCYSSDTEVLTDSGWKNYKDLNKSDLIGTMNNDIFVTEFQKYDNLVEYDYKGEMHHYKNRYQDILVTPNHRMLTRLPSEDDYTYKKSEEIDLLSPRFFRLNSYNRCSDYNIDDDWLRLFAWINSDGTVRQKKLNHRRQYYIYQVENKSYLIEDILKRLGIKYLKTYRKRKIKSICGVNLKQQENTHVMFHLIQKYTSISHLDFLDKHFKGGKYIVPPVLFECSQRQVKLYFSSFIDGDGTRKKNSSSWGAIYGIKEMLDQLQHLAVINGIQVKMNSYRNKNWRLYYNEKISNTCLNKNQKSTIDYSGKVWCLSTPNTNFITRRNGVVAIQGNSSKSFYLGDVLDVKYSDDKNVTVDNTAIPYKTFRWGKCLIGLSHGNRKDASEDRLVTWLNNEAAKYDGIKFKEVHCGDIHHLKEMRQRTGSRQDIYKATEDVNGVIIRYLKTIMYNDAWEGSKRYDSQKGAHAFIWNKDGGNEIILNANG